MVERVWLGNLGSAYGMKISKPGVDVGGAADYDLLFDTSSNYGRTLQMGLLSFPPSGPTTQYASVPSVGGGTPVVTFKLGSLDTGQVYLFPLYRREDNSSEYTAGNAVGWNASCSGTTITVTQTITTFHYWYIYYFALTLTV